MLVLVSNGAWSEIYCPDHRALYVGLEKLSRRVSGWCMTICVVPLRSHRDS